MEEGKRREKMREKEERSKVEDEGRCAGADSGASLG